MQIISTILCGGTGSRLWPVSRELHPKQFIQLKDGQSLLQKTFIRAAQIPGVAEVLTVTNQELFFKTQEMYQLVDDCKIKTSYILEPFGKNTAAAVASSALWTQSHYGDDAVMLILPADHVIENQDAFQSAIDRALQLASEGRLVTFGIQPTRPETGYGYIESNGEQVIRFVEKPSLVKAQEYCDAGNFLWNSGMFCFSVKTVLEQMQLHCPEILAATKNCMSEQGPCVKLDADLFAKVPEDSFDYAVAEKATTKLAVVPCENIGWNDIGSWQAFSDLSKPDDAGNQIDGNAILHDVKNCYVQSRDRLVGAVGIEDLVIIDTPDALLVAHKERAQDVKHLYNSLKQQGHDSHKVHRTVFRPWGSYTILEEGPRFKIKRLVVNPGASLSLQMHHHRSEHWIVVSGMARVTNGDNFLLVRTNESTYIPAGNHHRLENPGLLDLVMIEVQSGEYLGEDDIVRFEDHYGRV